MKKILFCLLFIVISSLAYVNALNKDDKNKDETQFKFGNSIYGDYGHYTGISLISGVYVHPEFNGTHVYYGRRQNIYIKLTIGYSVNLDDLREAISSSLNIPPYPVYVGKSSGTDGYAIIDYEWSNKTGYKVGNCTIHILDN